MRYTFVLHLSEHQDDGHLRPIRFAMYDLSTEEISLPLGDMSQRILMPMAASVLRDVLKDEQEREES